MKAMKPHELILEHPELLFADGFDEAIMGVGTQFNKRFIVYDLSKCVDILVRRDDMTHEEAVEFMDFNVLGAYVGENTPVFVELKDTDFN